MVRSATLMAFAGLLGLAACTKSTQVKEACTSGTASDPKAVVATVGGQAITAGELDDTMKEQLGKMERDHQKALFEARRQGLESLIVKRLVEAEAKKKGVSDEVYMKEEIDGKVPAATEAEAKEFFDKNPDKMGGAPYESLKERIAAFLTNQKRSQAAMKLFDELRTKAGVKVDLAEPEEPRVKVAATGPSKGPDGAKVTIVEFSDFQCPFCSRAKATVDQVMANYSGKVRLVFRDYPLPFHDKAQKAAEAGACANDQGKFWEMHDQMFGHQDKLAVDDLKKSAREIGLDGAKFDACLDGGKFATAVKENVKAGQEVGVQGTPHFFINGKVLSGAQPYEKFKDAIDRELASAK